MGAASTKPTLQEQIRENKRTIRRAIRELDRERMRLERQKQQLERDVRKYAKEGQMGPVKVMAKDYVRTKNNINKFYNMKSQLQGIEIRIQTMSSTDAMSRAMTGATQAMVRMGRQMNMPQLQKIMRDFQISNERMEMTQEMMGDAMDDVMEADGDSEEEEELVSKVLSELNINAMESAPEAPSRTTTKATAQSAAPQKQAVAIGDSDGPSAAAPPSDPGADTTSNSGQANSDKALSDLEARLRDLRK